MSSLLNIFKAKFLSSKPVQSFASACIHIDRSLDKQIPLLLVLLLVVVLRIPNFFEPYWYGDEAIYLTIGNALSEGSRLYIDIVDHKTPIIYFLAMVPNQFWFRVVLLGWMLVATTAFYSISQKLFSKTWISTTATVFFVLFTTLPWLEGNIPNGELFVLGFILVGGFLLTQTTYACELIDSKKPVYKKIVITPRQWLIFMLAGVLFGGAILTKVPALFDVLAFLSIGWFSVSNSLQFSTLFSSKKRTQLFITVASVIVILGGVITTVVASILYFYFRGSLEAYLNFGLLYNFHYVQSWVPEFEFSWLQTAYTLPVKLASTVMVIVAVTLLRDFIKPRMQFITTWFVLALFASLLSNRPYPHYFLQIIPPLAVLIGELLYTIQTVWEQKKLEMKNVFSLLISALVLFVFIGVLQTLKVGFYPTRAYYERTANYLLGKIDTATFNQKFNSRMKDNYHAAEIISSSDDQNLFIWGTNPELYALTKKIPTGRFTVSFHIKDLKAYEETITAVENSRPQFIVVMKNESEDLVGLQELLSKDYIVNTNFTEFELWKKQSSHSL